MKIQSSQAFQFLKQFKKKSFYMESELLNYNKNGFTWNWNFWITRKTFLPGIGTFEYNKNVFTWNRNRRRRLVLAEDAGARVEQDVVEPHRLEPALQSWRIRNCVSAHCKNLFIYFLQKNVDERFYFHESCIKFVSLQIGRTKIEKWWTKVFSLFLFYVFTFSSKLKWFLK